jgi:hypothetical protein
VADLTNLFRNSKFFIFTGSNKMLILPPHESNRSGLTLDQIAYMQYYITAK